MQARELKTVDQVIDALGGTTAAATFTGRKVQHVSNWRAYGKLPSNTFLTVSQELERLGFKAEPEIWGIQSPERAAS